MAEYKIIYKYKDWTRNGWTDVYGHLNINALDCFDARQLAKTELIAMSSIETNTHMTKPHFPNLEITDCVEIKQETNHGAELVKSVNEQIIKLQGDIGEMMSWVDYIPPEFVRELYSTLTRFLAKTKGNYQVTPDQLKERGILEAENGE